MVVMLCSGVERGDTLRLPAAGENEKSTRENEKNATNDWNDASHHSPRTPYPSTPSTHARQRLQATRKAKYFAHNISKTSNHE